MKNLSPSVPQKVIYSRKKLFRFVKLKKKKVPLKTVHWIQQWFFYGIYYKPSFKEYFIQKLIICWNVTHSQVIQI